MYFGLKKIADIKADGREEYYITDHLGTVNAVLDKDAATIQQYAFDPYGNMEYAQGRSDNRYLFTGKEFDPESGVFYFGARYYDSKAGRWLARDPKEEFFSSYVYCGNNPLINVDPNGEISVTFLLSDIVGGAVTVGLDENGFFGELTGALGYGGFFTFNPMGTYSAPVDPVTKSSWYWGIGIEGGFGFPLAGVTGKFRASNAYLLDENYNHRPDGTVLNSTSTGDIGDYVNWWSPMVGKTVLPIKKSGGAGITGGAVAGFQSGQGKSIADMLPDWMVKVEPIAIKKTNSSVWDRVDEALNLNEDNVK